MRSQLYVILKAKTKQKQKSKNTLKYIKIMI